MMRMEEIGRRFSLVGGVAAGVVGIVVGINAASDGEYVGAGVSLIAAALAFGFVGYVFRFDDRR